MAVLNDLLATEFAERRTSLRPGESLSRFAGGRPIRDIGSDWADFQTYKWKATADLDALTLQIEMKSPGASGSFTAFLRDPLITAHPWEPRVSTAGAVSDSRDVGLAAEPYTTPGGVRGVTPRVPWQGLQLLNPSGRARAFNIFNNAQRADNRPPDLNGAEPAKYRLALGQFDPRKLGYPRLAPAE